MKRCNLKGTTRLAKIAETTKVDEGYPRIDRRFLRMFPSSGRFAAAGSCAGYSELRKAG